MYAAICSVLLYRTHDGSFWQRLHCGTSAVADVNITFGVGVGLPQPTGRGLRNSVIWRIIRERLEQPVSLAVVGEAP